MADILDLIKSRRTIKNFIPQFVSWENLARIVDAGRHAPSCGNLQNWKFIVVDDESKKKAVADSCYEQFEIVGAHALIVICSEPEKAERYYGLRGDRLFSVQNCAAAAQNILLEAHSLGLGTSWIGAFDEEILKGALSIPEDVRPQAIIAVGYAREIPPKPPKYPLETVVYLNRWRGKMRDSAIYTHDVATILERNLSHAKEAVHNAAIKVSGSVVDVSKKIGSIVKK